MSRDTVRFVVDRLLTDREDGGTASAGSSVRTLNGTAEPYLMVHVLRNQPAATWQFVAEVSDDRGKVLARDAAEIKMPEDTGQ